MGCVLSGVFKDELAGNIIDTLQGKGLKQLEASYTFDFMNRKWSANDVFGTDLLGRNKFYRALKNSLIKPITDGFKLAHFNIGEANGFLEDQICYRISHHIMTCLLSKDFWSEKEVKVNYNAIQRDRLGLRLELPQYPIQNIEGFKQIWLGVAQRKSPAIKNLETTDHAEKAFFSSILAGIIIAVVIPKMDIKTIIKDAIEDHKLAESAAAAHIKGVFAQAPGLLKGREEYTEKEQKDDLGAAVLS